MNYPRVITTLQHTINIDIVQHAPDIFEWVTQSGKYGASKAFPSASKALDDARKHF